MKAQLERFLIRKSKSVLSDIQSIQIRVCNRVHRVKSRILPVNPKRNYQQISLMELRSFFLNREILDFKSTERPSVSVVIILYNKAELTLACLKSLLLNRSVPFELIIIDNASSDQTDHLLRQVRGAKVVKNHENLGFLKACNQAASLASSDSLLFLNNDTQVFQGSLAAALNTLKSSPDIGAVGARIINLDGRLQEAGNFIWEDGTCQSYGHGDDPYAGPYLFQRDVDYCSGAFLMTPKALFEKMGRFDEIFCPAYYEESDYCTTLRENGFRVVYEPKATILHYEFGSAENSNRAIELMLNHQQIFLKKHAKQLKNHFPKSDKNILVARNSNHTQRRILFIEDRVPYPELGAGYPRGFEILKALDQLGIFITLYPTLHPQEHWDQVYSLLPNRVEVILKSGEKQLKEFLKTRENYYDWIWVSRPHNMETFQRIRSSLPKSYENIKVIYDAEALFTNRNKAFIEIDQYRDLNPRLTPQTLQLKLQEELQLGQKTQAILSVSPAEKKQFESYGYQNVHILTYPQPASSSSHSTGIQTPFQEREHFLFLGAIHYHPSPNSDSVIWFAREIFPLIQRQLKPGVKFLIAGFNDVPEIQSLQSDSIQLLGKIDDLSQAFSQARVFIAPTRFAAGLPHKVHQATSFGVPVVATQLLAEQLDWRNGAEILSAPSNDPALFADQCVRLYSDESLWNKIRSGALTKLQSDCSEVKFNETLQNVLQI